MKSKNVLITGGNNNIGFETARLLGLLGYKVWIGGSDAELGLHTLTQLTSLGIEARLVVTDFTKEDGFDKAVQRLMKEDEKS